LAAVSTSLGLTPNVIHRTTNYELVRTLVARNFGISILVHRPKLNVTYNGMPLVVREAFVSFALDSFKGHESLTRPISPREPAADVGAGI
jgi:hypothetical protein